MHPIKCYYMREVVLMSLAWKRRNRVTTVNPNGGFEGAPQTARIVAIMAYAQAILSRQGL